MAETAELHTKIAEVTTLVAELRTKGEARDAEDQANRDAIASQVADHEVTIERLKRSRRIAAGDFDGIFTAGTDEDEELTSDARKSLQLATKAQRVHVGLREGRKYRDAFYDLLRVSVSEQAQAPAVELADVLRSKSAIQKVDLPERTKSALGTDFASGAGWLAPATMERQIDRLVLESSPFMALVSQRPCGSGSYEGLIRNLNREATQSLGQRQAPTPTTVEDRYILKNIQIWDQWAEPAVTSNALEDAFTDLESELTADAAEQFGIEEGRRIWSGTGVKEPFGISTNLSITRQPSGDAATFGMTAVRELPFRLKGPYLANGRYALSRQALIRLIGLREDSAGAGTGTGGYLWSPSSQDGAPSKLNSFPWFMAVDMDAVGANTLPLMFADFRQVYRAAIRRGMRVQRDETTARPYVLFPMSRRWGGDVWKAEAGIFLKCATS